MRRRRPSDETLVTLRGKLEELPARSVDLRYVFIPEGVHVALPQLRADASSADARAAILRLRDDIATAEKVRRRRPPADPEGLLAFTTPARPGCQRHVEQFELERSAAGPPVTYRLVIEATAVDAHICFVWQRDGGSICNQIERLTTRLYLDRFRGDVWTRLQGRLGWTGGPRAYSPGQMFFYEFDPVDSTSAGFRGDDFHRVMLTWSSARGFHLPQWKSYPSVPAYLMAASVPPAPLTTGHGVGRHRLALR